MTRHYHSILQGQNGGLRWNRTSRPSTLHAFVGNGFIVHRKERNPKPTDQCNTAIVVALPSCLQMSISVNILYQWNGAGSGTRTRVNTICNRVPRPLSHPGENLFGGEWGVEPTCPFEPSVFKTASGADCRMDSPRRTMERVARFELATTTLGTWGSAC